MVGRSLAGGRYQVARRLGSGGMAEVWAAWDTRLHVWRAIKLLRTEVAASSSLRARFEQEGRAMARLAHPNLLAIRDVGDEDGMPYLVMDLCGGGSLADRVRGGPPLAPALAARLVEEVLRALHHAHEAGVVHRDVKPHNVLLDHGSARVSDFGIARVLDTGSDLTRTGAMVGTLAYMAPEQRSSAGTADGRADVYAAAATLYWLLTLREPLDLYVERPGAFDGVPEPLAAVIRRGVRYLAAERWPDARAMADALAAVCPTLGPEPPLDDLPGAAAPPDPGSDTFSDSHLALATAAETPTAAPAPPAAPAPASVPAARRRWRAELAVAGVAVAGVARRVGGAWLARAPAERPWTTTRTLGWLAPGEELLAAGGGRVWFSAEDRSFVAALDGGGRGPYPGVSPAFVGGRVWDLVDDGARVVARRDGEEHTFLLPDRDQRILRLAPDGRAVLFGSEDGLYVVQEGLPPARLAGGDDGLYAAAWSPDGRRVAGIVQAGANAPPRLAVFELDPPSVRYLLEEQGLVFAGPRAGIAWDGPDAVVFLWWDADGPGLAELPVAGGTPQTRVRFPERPANLLALDDGWLVETQTDWAGVEVLGPDGAPGPALGDARASVEALGVAGDRVVVRRAGALTGWLPGGDEVPVPGVPGGTFGGEPVWATVGGVTLGGRPLGELPGELRCAEGGCWLRSAEGFRRFDPATGLGAEVFELDPFTDASWAAGTGGRLLVADRRDGFVMVDGSGPHAYGTFGATFLQHVADDGAGGAWLTAWRDAQWDLARWSPDGGLRRVTTRPGWFGHPLPLSGGRVAVERRFEGPRTWWRVGP